MEIEPQLLKACIKEDRRAQSELYRRCFGVLMGICMRYHHQEADALAVLNMGFLKILKNLKKRKQQTPFEPWIRRIMINTIIDEFRKDKKHKAHMAYTDFTDRDHYDQFVDFNAADRQFDAADIELMIMQLPDMSRQVFNLYAVDGYSHAEIADMLGISTGTSKWHVSTARKIIKTLIHQLSEHQVNIQ